MRTQDHIKISTAAALVVLPWLKKETWIPFTASVLIDVDHYLWHAATQRTFSLRAALRYFGRANPEQRSLTRLFHHPVVLTSIALIATYTRSRVLWLILSGFLFHVSLDTIHGTQMAQLKQTLSTAANEHCPACGQPCNALQLHTLHFTKSVFTRYRQQYFMVLCPACHEKTHARRAATIQLSAHTFVRTPLDD